MVDSKRKALSLSSIATMGVALGLLGLATTFIVLVYAVMVEGAVVLEFVWGLVAVVVAGGGVVVTRRWPALAAGMLLVAAVSEIGLAVQARSIPGAETAAVVATAILGLACVSVAMAALVRLERRG